MKREGSREGLLWTHWLRLEKRLQTKVVLIDAANDSSWTAPALTEATLPFADYLRQYRAGERIAFRLPNGPEWLALFLALQRAGLAAVPLDGGLPTEGCFESARQFNVRAVYLDGEFHSLGNSAAPVRNRKCCCVKITSGSGAIPKAIECRAGHLLADGRHIVRTMGIKAADLNLAVIPLGHSYGLGNLVMPLILQGTAMVALTAHLPRQWVDVIERYRVTVFPAVPTLLRVLADLPAGQGNLESLRTVISAGAMLNPSVAQAFFARYRIKIHNFYGSSETGAICYDRTGSASLAGGAVGKPFAGVSITVKAGRIRVGSAAVATRSGSWLLSDLGQWNKRGELVLLGRVGQGANISGKKVHPLEIECLLRTLPGVTNASVWLEQSQGHDLLAAGVETTHTRAEIERMLAAHLPVWKMPKACFVTRDFPRTLRGKLDLAALRALIQTHSPA